MKIYYPSSNHPLHEVRDWCKVRGIIRALNRGEDIPRVYMTGDLGSGSWLSGTHRVSASEIRAMIDPALEPYADLDLVNIDDYLSPSVVMVICAIHAEDAEAACDLLDATDLDEQAIMDILAKDFGNYLREAHEVFGAEDWLKSWYES